MNKNHSVYAMTCLAIFIALFSLKPDTHAASLDDMFVDKIEVRVELDVHYLKEHSFSAGDPPQTVRSDLDIGFRRSGNWIFARMKDRFGGGYRAFPGRSGKPEFPAVSNVAVTANHPCQDGEGFVIGRETVHPGAAVHPALGGIDLRDAGHGRVAVYLMPSQIDVDSVECPRQECNAGFPSGWITIGENQKATTEDDDDDEYEEIEGFKLGNFDWNSLKAVAKDGDLELTLPLSIDNVSTETYDDHLGYPESTRESYRVKGWIGPVVKDS